MVRQSWNVTFNDLVMYSPASQATTGHKLLPQEFQVEIGVTCQGPDLEIFSKNGGVK
jgi:hypothetical protein